MSESYSQYGEDQIITKLLAGRASGRLLDIGAWHPKTFSNSRMLIEAGWEAMLVEFSPKPIRDLVEEYANHPGVKVLQAAVTVVDGGMAAYDVTDDGLSTCSAEHKEKWEKDGGYFGKLWVSQIPIRQLLEQFGGGFDFVSIDTEGTSVDLARYYLGVLGQLPLVMCVEHDGRSVELMEVAQERGYRMVHMNGTNVVLSRI